MHQHGCSSRVAELTFSPPRGWSPGCWLSMVARLALLRRPAGDAVLCAVCAGCDHAEGARALVSPKQCVVGLIKQHGRPAVLPEQCMVGPIKQSVQGLLSCMQGSRARRSCSGNPGGSD